MSVTFEIKVFENDWKYVLYGDYLEKLIKNCNHNFLSKHLIINNVNNISKVLKYAEKKVKKGVVDKVIVVEENLSQVLTHFGLDKDSFKEGYYYSIAELTGIYFCKTEFLFHFSSDSYINKFEEDWISKAIKELALNDDFIVANPVWNNRFDEAKNEAKYEIDDFFVGYGFSDQCYLIKNDVFKKRIYNFRHLESERYPKYGGELFEKKVDAFMRNNHKFRLISKINTYTHFNFPNKSFWYNFKIYSRLISKKRLK